MSAQRNLLRVMLVDDEPPALKRMRALLARIGDVVVIGEFTDAGEAIAAVSSDPPDVLFLDIQMPELSGFDILGALGGQAPLTVFVTAYNEHALKAFDAHAFDYLLKPVALDRLGLSVTRARERLATETRGDLAARIEGLLRGAQAPTTARRLSVRHKGSVRLVDVADIDWIDISGNNVQLHVGREVLAFRGTLGEVEQRLPAETFVRIQRGIILNVSRVREIQPWFHGDYVFLLRDGSKQISGRTYRDELKRIFDLP